jgi:hypothetical protein
MTCKRLFRCRESQEVPGEGYPESPRLLNIFWDGTVQRAKALSPPLSPLALSVEPRLRMTQKKGGASLAKQNNNNTSVMM